MKKYIPTATFALILFALFIIMRYGFIGLYTPEWGTRSVYGIVVIMILFPVMFGKIRFSTIALSGYIVGIIAGEVFGAFRSEVPEQFLHYGWLICSMVFVGFCFIGVMIEELSARKREEGETNEESSS